MAVRTSRLHSVRWIVHTLLPLPLLGCLAYCTLGCAIALPYAPILRAIACACSYVALALVSPLEGTLCAVLGCCTLLPVQSSSLHVHMLEIAYWGFQSKNSHERLKNF